MKEQFANYGYAQVRFIPAHDGLRAVQHVPGGRLNQSPHHRHFN